MYVQSFHRVLNALNCQGAMLSRAVRPLHVRRLSGLLSVRAPHGSFTVVLRPLPRFTLSACLAVLTLSVYHTFGVLSRTFFNVPDSFLNQNAVNLLTLWIIAHLELFVKNFFRLLTAFRPCYAVSGVYVQSMTSGVPLSRRRFIDCLHDTTLCAFCQARFFTFSAVIYLQSCFLLRFRYLSFLLIADFHYILRIFQTILIFRPE